MAASDQLYRSQRVLDIVFSVSCVLMLLSTIWMFAQDYYRPYKAEQRAARDVEVAVAQRVALLNLPPKAAFDRAKAEIELAKEEMERRQKSAAELKEELSKVESDLAALRRKLASAGKDRKAVEQELQDKLAAKKSIETLIPLAEKKLAGLSLADVQAEIVRLTPLKDKAEATYQVYKGQLDSKRSFYDIAVEQHGKNSEEARSYLSEAEYYQRLTAEAEAERDRYVSEIRRLQQLKSFIQEPLIEAQSRFKKLVDDFESQVKTARDKQWGLGDWFRGLWVIEAFASPTKINQYTINDVPIDYNFKYVTRFDRCTSCHTHIDKPAFTKEMLRSLDKVTEEEQARLDAARELLAERRQALEGLPEQSQIPTPEQLRLDTVRLSESRINQFCAHPRLELFVGSNSKHPAEKFGCSSCHAGQGSATDFTLAAHTPNDAEQKQRWQKQHGWESQHFWDFPMLPLRFVESSCVKCHHEITSLVSVHNRQEAPKLLKGFTLFRELGCFGCHEVKGRKAGDLVGPDVRLEPTPPLEEIAASERERLLADPENRPGTYRKVGPSLYRLSEKTNEEWTARWLQSPRSFRPDTRMPHFYGLSTNNPEYLRREYEELLKAAKDDEAKKQIVSQEKFPDAEIRAITYYLFTESNKFLQNVASHQKDDEAARQKDLDLVASLSLKPSSALSEAEKQSLAAAQQRIRYRKAAAPFQPLRSDYKGDAARGRLLFSMKGCLACHLHPGTESEKEAVTTAAGEKKVIPAMHSDAQHGPDLGQIRAKLGRTEGDLESARVWLMNWIKDPAKYSPRTKMPAVPLSDEEIIDITTWLLEQPAEPHVGKDWEKTKVKPADEETLKQLADVYLSRQMPAETLARLKKEGRLEPQLTSDLPEDERRLTAAYTLDAVRYYVGKKAVSRLGCFGCHDIPGFDDAKPIGVGLNDWGRRDPTRLAFEDIVKYVEENYHVVDKMTTTQEVNGKTVEVAQPFAKGEHGHVTKPYEEFFFEALKHHDRIGFLHQKLLEPRSYDYNRIRAWDDRARMPQFSFARPRRKPGESEQAYQERRWKEEADGREALMTFVLGLVAEKIPLASLHQPSGDRLAQIKGRLVLEKYNCNGCHQIQPGQYEFYLSGKTLELVKINEGQQAAALSQDFTFYDHHAWTGGDVTAAKGRAKAFGIPYLTFFAPSIDRFKDSQVFLLRLTEAFRYYDEKDQPHDLRAGQILMLRPDQMIHPPPHVFHTREAFAEYDKQQGTFGGDFAIRLTKFLTEYNPNKRYEPDPNTGDNNDARASVPPPLLGQGGRTQPDWLFRFLLNPQPVRKMVVLRMPRFNLSREEAETLVAYFTAVERLTNPRFEVNPGQANVPQKADLTEPYWRQRTEEYVRHLKNTKTKDGNQSLYDQRVAELRPIWELIAQDLRGELSQAKMRLADAEALRDSAKREEKAAQEAFDKAPGDEKAKLAAQLKAKQDAAGDAEKALVTWQDRVAKLEELVKNSTPDKQQQRWETQEAYVVDAFRLLGSPGAPCVKCHQVGSREPSDPKQMGPPLGLAQERLRPDWIIHWVAKPDRLMTYPSPMPAYFPQDQPGQFHELFAGAPLEQIRALSDVLMIYDRALEMPVSRYVLYPVAKKHEEKKGEKK